MVAAIEVNEFNGANGVKKINGSSKPVAQGVVINGAELGNGVPDTTKAWRTLSQYLPNRDADTDFWWKYCGLHMAILLEEAEYPADKQTEALVFFYHWCAPYMGASPSPHGKPLRWRSGLQPDGTPIEYSWKWPQAGGGKPEIRYDFEPISDLAGTEADILGQLAAKELMSKLKAALPDAKVDNTWFYHFMSTLFEHDNTKLMDAVAKGEPVSNTVLMAAEFLPKGVSFKTYIQPRVLGYPGAVPTEVYENSIAGIEAETPARRAVNEFLRVSEEGKKLVPFSMGVDNRAGSRLKWYFLTPHTSFESMRAILTLDGQVQHQHLERQLGELKDLLYTVLGLPEDFPESEHPGKFLGAKTPYHIPPPPPGAPEGDEGVVQFLTGYPYYFDVAPGQDLPGVKWSLPVRNFPGSDLFVAEKFVAWLEKQGRGAYGQRYLSMLHRMAAAKGLKLSECNGLQSFISVLMRPDGQFDVTTYFSAYAWEDEKHKQEQRGVRAGGVSRGDW
ncbi:hypothetical protein G7054_g3107 [Neopestalotiopsis clavispora]|nr:hypothetical protein G7054_g3107 [Neopestalotiopsis clavispora]